MPSRLAIGIASIALTACASGTQGPAAIPDRDLAETLRGKSLVFIGAHPDDETVLMPIFVEACVFNGARCHFVSVTPGEMGCLGTMQWIDMEKCASERLKEFTASAALANGTAETLGWQDLFYAHDGEGLRRNFAAWEARHGGREGLVDALAAVIERQDADVVFSLDPRHGSSCSPNHRAPALLLAEAVERMPAAERPRVLFENTFTVFERMPDEVAAAVETGAMFPWPGRDDPNIYYDVSRILPDGRQAIEYQIDALRAHASQFPDLPEELAIEADPAQLRIALLDLADIDPAEELCSPLALTEYKTIDRTLSYVGRKYSELAEAAGEELAFVLKQDGEVVGAYGDLAAWPHKTESTFPDKKVSLIVAAVSPEAAEAARDKYLEFVLRFVEAPE